MTAQAKKSSDSRALEWATQLDNTKTEEACEIQKIVALFESSSETKPGREPQQKDRQ